MRSAIRVYCNKVCDCTSEERTNLFNELQNDEKNKKKKGNAVMASPANEFASSYYRPLAKDELDSIRDKIIAERNGRIEHVKSFQKYRTVNEITAAYIADGSSDDYKHICQAWYPEGYGYSEGISFIGTVKNDASVPDSEADLFIGKLYVGSSFSIENWYAFSPDGFLSTFCIHDMNPDSYDAKWEWKTNCEESVLPKT